MGSCNTAQNEVGGKDLLLKVCKEMLFTTDATTSSVEITAHGLKVGTPLVFTAAALGAIVTLLPNKPYFVKTVVDVDNVILATTPTGIAIIPGAVVTDAAVDVFVNVGGIRSKGITFTSEGIDITSQDSDEWTKMLDSAGLRSVALSGSGVYTNEANYTIVEDAAYANSLICLMFIDVKGLKVLWGCYKVTQVENSGDYNAEGNFTLAASSSGEINRAKVV